jgi:transcriptional regulator
MYCPAHFAESRPDVLWSLVAQHPLATLVYQSPQGLVANHLPLLRWEPSSESNRGAGEAMIGHVARNNPLWQLAEGQSCLLVFQGPSAYVSPNWYPTKAEHGKVVPTWNYAVVHVHATLTALQEPTQIRQILSTMTDHFEQGLDRPWAVDDAPEAFTERLLEQIVGLRLNVQGIQGKWKISQNQPEANRCAVRDALAEHPGQSERAVADWMSRT